MEIKLVEGYRTEVNLRIKRWLKDVACILSEGFIITVDYGYPSWQYYSEERGRGTLICYESHKVSEDFYEGVGRKDITAHVNFSALKRWAEALGFKTLGFSTQGSFLVSLGIDEVITELYGDSPEYPFEVTKIKGLLLPGTMGETHKVMIHYMGKEEDVPCLRGFSLKNQIKNL
ncbi:MAG: SAM-dependent methyltransferase [Nitrospirae bacterium]|nr:SAM-dependent methyltransferase [Nitrospirota bacterium]